MDQPLLEYKKDAIAMVKPFSIIFLILITVMITSCSGSREDQDQSALPPDTTATSVNIDKIPEEQLPWNDGNERYQFRRTWWGMSKEEVKASEAEPPGRETEDKIYYKGNILGLEAYYIYEFYNNRLVYGRCVFSHKRAEPGDYVDDYHFIKDAIQKRFDKPASDSIEWFDSTYADEKNYWDSALVKGQMAYKSALFTRTTVVITTLSWFSGEPELVCMMADADFIRTKDFIKPRGDTLIEMQKPQRE